MSLAWRSPRSIPTGQDGRRPLQHKLKVTYIYVLKCITHPLRTELPFSFRRLQPSLVSPSTRLHGHRTSSLLSRCPGIHLPGVREFCKSHGYLAPREDGVDAEHGPHRWKINESTLEPSIVSSTIPRADYRVNVHFLLLRGRLFRYSFNP